MNSLRNVGVILASLLPSPLPHPIYQQTPSQLSICPHSSHFSSFTHHLGLVHCHSLLSSLPTSAQVSPNLLSPSSQRAQQTLTLASSNPAEVLLTVPR